MLATNDYLGAVEGLLLPRTRLPWKWKLKVCLQRLLEVFTSIQEAAAILRLKESTTGTLPLRPAEKKRMAMRGSWKQVPLRLLELGTLLMTKEKEKPDSSSTSVMALLKPWVRSSLFTARLHSPVAATLGLPAASSWRIKYVLPCGEMGGCIDGMIIDYFSIVIVSPTSS